MNKPQRRLLLIYAGALPPITVWAGYSKGRARGESVGLAAAGTGVAIVIWVGVMAGAVFYNKLKGRQGGTDHSDEHPVEERSRPPGWWWDEGSKRWRKPPRPGG